MGVLEPTVTRKDGVFPRCQHHRDGKQCRNRAHGTGFCGVHYRDAYITTWEAAKRLGLSTREFLKIAGPPDHEWDLWVPNKSGHWVVHPHYLWLPARIERMKQSLSYGVENVDA